MSTVNTWPITSRGQVETPFSSDIIIGRNIACVASVSNRVTARKLEREQKKKKVSFPSPSLVLSFFCSRPNFLDELARKRLLRRLVEIRHFNVLASAANTTSIDYGQSLSFFYCLQFTTNNDHLAKIAIAFNHRSVFGQIQYTKPPEYLYLLNKLLTWSCYMTGVILIFQSLSQ